MLIRNYGNLEIDVKCRSFRDVKGEKRFDFKCDEAKKLFNMQGFTNTPVLIAVYENINNRPIEETVYMFSITALIESTEIEKYYRKGIGKCYSIPLSFTEKGLNFIEKSFLYTKRVRNSTNRLEIS